MKTSLNWQLGFTRDPQQPPTEFIPATVPGAVQLDWARAHGWPQPEYDPDLSKYAWMEDVYWLYRAELAFELGVGERLFFVCKGVDYQFEVRLNGEVIHEQEGMFTPIELDLSTHNTKPGDALEVLVFPAPKSCETPVDRNQANQSCKPAVAYGWDFHPRLIPLGVWDEAYVEMRATAHFVHNSFVVEANLWDNCTRGTPGFQVDVVGMTPTHVIHWRIVDSYGDTAADEVVNHIGAQVGEYTTGMSIQMQSPELWWPSGQGQQNLYRSTIELIDVITGQVLDRIERKFGFRQVRLIMHPTQWQEKAVEQFPKGRHTSPITLELNGRHIFAKGSNWVTPTMLPGTLTKDQYRSQLQAMKDANMNIVRCWGGANVQKDSFFEICDELGLMVWQEFPLACNRYEGTSEYLGILEQEAQSIVNRLQSHPSVVLWCGGNELFNNWSKMTDQDLALRLLNKVCYDLDRNTPFLMTSPAMGMAHGGYFFRRPDNDHRNGAEVYQYFANSAATAYTEFGVPAPPSAETLRKIIPADELWPPQPGTQWETRHAFKAWEPNSWLDLPTIRDYFGEPRDLDQLVEWAQWLQSEGYTAIFEEARRQKPTCSMALNWCLNEPWPTAANNSLIAWPCEPKPALRAVGQSCRPILASARIPKFSWRSGEVFSCDLFLLNDSPEVAQGDIEAMLTVGGQVISLGSWENARAEMNQNAIGPTLRAVLPPADSGPLRLTVRVDDKPEWDSEYVLLFKTS
jgi:beta-mannosidase